MCDMSNATDPLTSLTNPASPKQKQRFLKYMFENAAT